MSRIEANIATQVADVSRPQQTQRDRHDQQVAQQARSSGMSESQAGQDVRAEEVRAAAAELKQVVEIATGRDLNFDVFEDTDQLFVKVRDGESGEEIKQIPSQDVLELRSRIQELVGVFVDEEA